MTVSIRQKIQWRLVAFRALVLATLLVVTLVSLAIFLLPTKADRAAEYRLLGKWGMYAPTSDLTLPPDRVIEFLPQGQTADYSPELELLGRTSDTPGLKSNWYVHRGALHTMLRNPSVFKGALIERHAIEWIDDDNFVLKGSLDGSPLRYRRITPGEIFK